MISNGKFFYLNIFSKIQLIKKLGQLVSNQKRDETANNLKIIILNYSIIFKSNIFLLVKKVNVLLEYLPSLDQKDSNKN